MKTKEIDEMIDAYVRGDLGKQQMSFVEDKIKSDEAFREAYTMYIGIRKALLDDDMKDYEKLLKDVYHKKNTSLPVRRSKNVYYAAAAAILVLVALGIVLFLQMTRKTHNEQLFDQYYTNYIFDSYRSGQQSLLIKGYEYYMGHDYDSAMMIARQSLKKQESVQASFLAGVSLLANGKYSESIRYFSLVARSDNVSLKESAEWYKALALIKLNRVEESALLLSKIKVAENDYADRATELLNKIQQ